MAASVVANFTNSYSFRSFFQLDDVNENLLNDPLYNFNVLSSDFSKFHQDPTNILLHFVTTPLGLIGLFGIIRYYAKSSTPGVLICTAYLLSLIPLISIGAWIGTAIMLGFILLAIRAMSLKSTTTLYLSIILLISGYILQDVSHIITGEETFQSTYSNGGHIDTDNLSFWCNELLKHTYYLLPLVIDIVLPNISNKAFGLIPNINTLRSPLPTEVSAIYNCSLWLAPLVFWAIGGYCLDSKNGFCCFPGFAYKKRVLQSNICTDAENVKESRKKDLKIIRDWSLKQDIVTEKTSSHFWVSDLPPKQRDAFNRCAHSMVINRMFRNSFSDRHYELDIVDGMNEVYITGPSRENQTFNSDQIFYTKHVDGPYGLMPFVSVFRCIVGMDENHVTSTTFPLVGLKKAAREGDVLAFDFNREVHYIESDNSKKDISDKFRVVLKLHYCVYPKILAPIGWLAHALNVKYNITFRALFLKTINPITFIEKALAFNVVVNTTLFNTVEACIGQRNFVYLIVSLLLWQITGRYYLFLSLTSFVHYIRYISTYYTRVDIDFGSFKRDVLLFKTLAVTQLFLHYLFPEMMSGDTSLSFEMDFISISMIAIGYIASMMATAALGVDRTYFGAELGLMQPKFVTSFPYGYIPHPMITSQLFALAGFLKASHFRAATPWWVIPVHMVLYLTHMTQEIFDVHAPSDVDSMLMKAKAQLSLISKNNQAKLIAEFEKNVNSVVEMTNEVNKGSKIE